VNGLAATTEAITSITYTEGTVSRKLVNVYDKLPSQVWTVHGELETVYG